MYVIIQTNSWDDWKTYNVCYTSYESKAKTVCSGIEREIAKVYDKFHRDSKWVKLDKGDYNYTSGYNAEIQALTEYINGVLGTSFKFDDIEYIVRYGTTFGYSKLRPL